MTVSDQAHAATWERGAEGRRAMDVSSLAVLVQRRWRLFLAFAIAVPLLTLLASAFMTPVFSATAQIRLNPLQRALPEGQAQPSGGLPDQGLVDTEVSILRSRDIAGAVVDQLHLDRLAEFNTPRPGLVARLTGAARKPLTAEDRRDVAIGTVLGQLDAKREGVSYVIDITARSRDGELASRIANAFADGYIANNIASRVQVAERQSRWLDERLNGLGEAARRADAAVAQYRAANGLATSGGAGGLTVTDQQIVPLSTELANADSEAAASSAKLSLAQKQAARGSSQNVPSVLTSPLIAELQRQRTEVLRNAAEVSTRYGPLHPDSIRVRQQLGEVDQAIRAETGRIVASLSSDASAAGARASSLRSRLGSITGAQSRNVEASVEGDSLQRQADSARLIYNQFAQASQQLAQERQSQEPQARLFNRATPAGVPSFPNRKLLAVLGLVAGMVAGAAVIVLLEALDGSVRTVDDVEGGLGENLAACLPRPPGGPGSGERAFAAVADAPRSPFAEGVRALRSSVILGAGGSGSNVLAVTSPSSTAGESYVAGALARSLALGGRRTLLLKARSSTPAGAKPTGTALTDVLAGRKVREEALQRDTTSGLHSLSVAPGDEAAGADLGGEGMERFLRDAREHYEWIVLDLPSVLNAADARTLCARADLVLLAAEWGRTHRQTARAALSRLHQDGARVLGVALVNVDAASPHPVGVGSQAFFTKLAHA